MKFYFAIIPIFLVLITGLNFFPKLTFASEVAIRPFLIDETLTARGVATNVINLSSGYTNRKAVLFATVNEITTDATGEIKEFISPSMTDRTQTAASWIEVTRGRIEIEPGATVEIPLTIRTHPFAESGEYQVFIGFVEAPNRPKAEEVALTGKAKGVIVKITIDDEKKESMRISGFMVNRFIIGEDKRDIDIKIENNGDIGLRPVGEIVFYDSRGMEVSSVPVNENASVIAPGENVTLSAKVPIDNKMGRYKANVLLRYGDRQSASLQDTAMFYMMPLHLLVALFGAILTVTLVMVFLFRRTESAYYDDDEKVDEVRMYIREGEETQSSDHDINLKKN